MFLRWLSTKIAQTVPALLNKKVARAINKKKKVLNNFLC